MTVVDLNKHNLQYCIEKYGAFATDKIENILIDDNIKAVSICTPNQTHYKIAKDCINSGKNVLVEKPLAMTIEEGRDLIELAKDKNIILAVGHIFRYNNSINKIKQMIDSYELGNIRIIKLNWSNIEPLFVDRDVIFDLAPHPFDIINYLFNRNPDELSCIGNAFRRSRNKGSEAVFITGMLGDIILSIELSWLTPPKTRSLVLVGSKKTALVDCLNQKIHLVENGKYDNVQINPNNTIRDELKNFLDCIKNKDNRNINDGHAGLDTLKMIEICQKSLKNKKTLKFEWV